MHVSQHVPHWGERCGGIVRNEDAEEDTITWAFETARAEHKESH